MGMHVHGMRGNRVPGHARHSTKARKPHGMKQSGMAGNMRDNVGIVHGRTDAVSEAFRCCKQLAVSLGRAAVWQVRALAVNNKKMGTYGSTNS